MNELQEKLNKLNLPTVDVDEYIEDPIMRVKITIEGLDDWAWYISAFDGDSYLFGYVVGLYPELGYFDLEEIISTAHYDFSLIKVKSIEISLSKLKKKLWKK